MIKTFPPNLPLFPTFPLHLLKIKLKIMCLLVLLIFRFIHSTSFNCSLNLTRLPFTPTTKSSVSSSGSTLHSYHRGVVRSILLPGCHLPTSYLVSFTCPDIKTITGGHNQSDKPTFIVCVFYRHRICSIFHKEKVHYQGRLHRRDETLQSSLGPKNIELRDGRDPTTGTDVLGSTKGLCGDKVSCSCLLPFSFPVKVR